MVRIRTLTVSYRRKAESDVDVFAAVVRWRSNFAWLAQLGRPVAVFAVVCTWITKRINLILSSDFHL